MLDGKIKLNKGFYTFDNDFNFYSFNKLRKVEFIYKEGTFRSHILAYIAAQPEVKLWLKRIEKEAKKKEAQAKSDAIKGKAEQDQDSKKDDNPDGEEGTSSKKGDAQAEEDVSKGDLEK
jgi:phosphopantothenoylcysteine synthetase/decarboxylase